MTHLFLVAWLQLAPATVPASAPAAAPHVLTPPARRAVSPAEVEAALRSHGTYQELRLVLEKIDAEIRTSRLGAAHFKTVRMKKMLEVYRAKLDDIRAEVEAELAVGPSRFPGEALGLVVTKAPPAATAPLNVARGAGLVVDRVFPDTAAAAAGILPGDVLHRLDGQLLVNNEQFEVVVGAAEPGREVQVELFRDGEALKRTIRVGVRAK